jgi:hypothetical protein
MAIRRRRSGRKKCICRIAVCCSTFLSFLPTPHLITNIDYKSHDCPQVNADHLAEVEQLAKELGVDFKSEGELSGWKGGRVLE